MADKPRAMNRKFVPEPYDMDTMLGTNNSGVLMFSPYLEDTDTVSAVISGEGGSDAPVFNAQDSVLWQNLRDAFRDQITTMYRNLRAGNKWNAKYITTFFEEMQAKWPEAMFNEDARTKYLIPLIDPVTVDEDTGELIRTDRYLTMLQGSKAEQRKWWTYNRFRYMDSKYNTGDASKTINLRLFNGGTLTLTPAIDLYVGVSFGGGTTPALKRTTAETPQTFEYVAPSGVTEMETWIYSADLITDVGDLSVFYPNELDFSRAARLRRLKVGSDATGYANNNLTTINVSNNPLLEYIDCRNCPRLAESIEIEKSTRLKEAYFEGSGITGIELADGCTIEHLHLPASITALTLMNLDKLTDLQLEGVSNVTRLMLANMSTSVIDPIEIIEQIPANSQIYIEGLNLEMANATEIDEFMDFLDTMKGVTRTRSANGSWSYTEHDKAQVSGRIHTNSLTGAEIAEFRSRYPYINVVADHTTSYIYYHNWERDSDIVHTETVYDGGNGTYNGTLTHASTPANTFTFIGWSRTPQSTTVDSGAQTAITEDRHLYAVYRLTGQVYTVTFQNPYNSSDNATVQNVPYGGSASYPKSTTPTYSGNDQMVFSGWSPSPTNIQGNLTCVAQFQDMSSPVIKFLKRTITSYESETNTTIAPYAFQYCSELTEIKGPFTSFGESAFLNCSKLKTADITGNGVASISSNAFQSSSSFESLIIRSTTMATLGSATTLSGTKIDAGLGAIYVPSSMISTYKANTNWSNYAILPIDSYPATNFDTISDSWETIISNIKAGNYSQYKIGDTKSITYDGMNVQLQLIGTDKDVLASDETKTVATTWAFRHIVISHRMNATNTNANGYPASEMYTYLQECRAKLPDIIKNNIVTVKKTYRNYTTSSTLSTDEDFWLFSMREIFGSNSSYESSGCIYDQFFTSSTKRIKYNLNGSATYWWTRSAGSSTRGFRGVSGGGGAGDGNASGSGGVVPGFCI